MKEGQVIAFTQKALAKKLGVSERTIYTWRKEKGLPSIDGLGQILILPEDLKAFFKAHRKGGAFYNRDELAGIVDEMVESVMGGDEK